MKIRKKKYFFAAKRKELDIGLELRSWPKRPKNPNNQSLRSRSNRYSEELRKR
jgi:hypothetical protein